MYSACLAREDVMEIRKYIKPYSPRLYRALGRAARQLLEIKKEGETERILESTGTLPLTLLQAQGEMDRLLEEPPSQEVVGQNS